MGNSLDTLTQAVAACPDSNPEGLTALSSRLTSCSAAEKRMLAARTFTDSQEAPVHKACELGHVEALVLLLDTCAAPDAVLTCEEMHAAWTHTAEKRAETPLHVAVRKGNVEAARVMLYHGADPLIRGRYSLVADSKFHSLPTLAAQQKDLVGTALDFAQTLLRQAEAEAEAEAGTEAETEATDKSHERQVYEDLVCLLISHVGFSTASSSDRFCRLRPQLEAELASASEVSSAMAALQRDAAARTETLRFRADRAERKLTEARHEMEALRIDTEVRLHEMRSRSAFRSAHSVESIKRTLMQIEQEAASEQGNISQQEEHAGEE